MKKRVQLLSKNAKYKGILREIVMVFLALTSVFLMLLEVVAHFNLLNFLLLKLLDIFISFIFLGDFFLHMHLSPSPPKAFIKRHWIELFAAVPLISDVSIPLRIGRLLLRIKILLEASLEYTKHAYLIYVFVTSIFVLIADASGFYYFEYGINSNVHSFFDAIWWAIVTSTTIGYGDIFPITIGGRIVAIIVMLIGITAFGTFVATVETVLIKNRVTKFKIRKQ